jgi:hypothetical protein
MSNQYVRSHRIVVLSIKILKVTIMLNRLFRKKAPTVEDIQKKVDAIMLRSAVSESQSFIEAFQGRTAEFSNAVFCEQDPSEKDNILHQYNRFVTSVKNCLDSPSSTNSVARSYFCNSRYYPVAIKDFEKPNYCAQLLSTTSFLVGLGILVASIPAFFLLTPVAGTIGVVLSMILLIPSCFQMFLPDSPDTSKMKHREKEIFVQAAQLIAPDTDFGKSDDRSTDSAGMVYSEYAYYPNQYI